MMYQKEFALAKTVAMETGAFLSVQTDKKIDSQEGKDIKLELDRISEKKIVQALMNKYDYPILSEEIGLTKEMEVGMPYWIIDPIDGTLNFSRGNPSSCISIALWQDQKPICGVIYDFNRDELFSGYVGVGAWLNNEKIKFLDTKKKSQAILSTGFPTYMNDDDETLQKFIQQIQQYKKIRMIGSAALSLAYVACGRFDSYIEENIKLWDIAAGVAICQSLSIYTDVEFKKDFSTNTKAGVV